MSSGDGQPHICPKELMGLHPSSAPLRGISGKICCLAPGLLLHICRPAIDELNNENHGWFSLITGFCHFQSMGWPLLKFGFLSCRSSWDFWCDQSVCVWLTQGQEFLRNTRSSQTLLSCFCSRTLFVPFWKREGLSSLVCSAGCQKTEGSGIR